jgi:butyryl-CoA dehydrogenase
MLCAEAVGAMDRALSMTRDYLRTRKQFGKAITDNQVIRHRLVDMMVAIEHSRAITEAAAHDLDRDARGRRRAVSLAKAFVSGRAARARCVQLHGRSA